MNEAKRLDFSKAMENVRRNIEYRSIERWNGLAEYDEDDLRRFMRAIGERLVPDFSIDNMNASVYENVRKWADARPFKCLDPSDPSKVIPGNPKKGLYICGPTGSGKSVLVSVIRTYLASLYAKIRIGEQVEPMTWESRRADEICVEYAKSGDLAQFLNARILCVHDVGSEQNETMYMGNRVEVIRTILEYRGDRNNLMTILTSNDRIIDARYGERVASRLCEMCNYYELTGKDRRIR